MSKPEEIVIEEISAQIGWKVIIKKIGQITITTDGSRKVPAGEYTITGLSKDCNCGVMRGSKPDCLCKGAIVLDNKYSLCYRIRNSNNEYVLDNKIEFVPTRLKPNDINIHEVI